MKQKLLLHSFTLRAAMLVGLLLSGGANLWAETKTKTEGFESAATSTSYQGTVTVSEDKSDCGIGWEIYYGNVSTSSAITGSNSAALRLYTSANYGYLKTTTPVEGLSKVEFNIKAATTNSAEISVIFSYSPDGETWTDETSFKPGTSITKEKYYRDIPEGNKYIKFAISSNSTKPSKSNAQLTIDDIVFTYEEEGSSSSAVATTTAIDATSLTNTDVHTSTTAGTLTATVKDNDGSAIEGAAVTWSSSNTDVATIDENGAVTLVAAGTTTITASYAGVKDEYQSSSDTYELQVTSSAPKEQKMEVELPLTNGAESFNCSTGTDNTTTSRSFTQDDITVTYSKGTGSQIYAASTGIRIYGGNSLSFEAPEGYVIVKVVLTTSSTDNLTTSDGSYDGTSHTWTGSASTVTLTRPSGSGNVQPTKATVTLSKPSSVATPTFSIAAGTYEEAQSVTIACETEGAEIYYTTDGTEPSSESTKYAGAIAIEETTTVKAVAIKDGESSAVASATYTFPTIYKTIAAFMEANTTGYLNLTGAQVVYIDDAKKNIYVRDASGAIDLFNNSGFSTSLKTGDILKGTINGKYSPYKNLPEIANIADISKLTATDNQTVVAKVIDGTTEAIAANLCDLVKIENTEITESSSKYYVGDDSNIQLFDNFKVGYTVTAGQSVDVSGIATIYDKTYELFPRFESDIVYLASSESVSIASKTGYGTFASDHDLDFSGTDAIKVFYATVEGTTLTFHQITKVAAGTGVLLVSAEGGAVAATNVPYLNDEADDTTGNVFVRGTGEAVSYSESDQNYILFNGTDGIGFYQANQNTVAENRAYIHVAEGVGVKSFAINLGDEDAINEMVNGKSLNGKWYNLAGQRVQKAQKGLYIVGGKKVVVK